MVERLMAEMSALELTVIAVVLIVAGLFFLGLALDSSVAWLRRRRLRRETRRQTRARLHALSADYRR